MYGVEVPIFDPSDPEDVSTIQLGRLLCDHCYRQFKFDQFEDISPRYTFCRRCIDDYLAENGLDDADFDDLEPIEHPPVKSPQ